MRRKVLYLIGRTLDRLGLFLEAPGIRLHWFGMTLWDENCDCDLCEKRKKDAKRLAR